MKQYWADAATCNCVWLFQVKQYIIENHNELDHLDREDLIQRCLEHTKSIREIIDYVKEYENEGTYPECLIQYKDDTWYTEGVFLLREEARKHGQSRPYAWGKENEGWRIYGVPLHGIALEYLSSCGVNQDYIDENLK